MRKFITVITLLLAANTLTLAQDKKAVSKPTTKNDTLKKKDVKEKDKDGIIVRPWTNPKGADKAAPAQKNVEPKKK